MKKTGIILLALTLLCGCFSTLAEEAQYAPPTLYDASELAKVETHYLLFDEAFYEAESASPGKVVKVKYTTDVYGESTKRWANVYLPYGYDETDGQKYPVIYFLHGGGCDQNTLLGNPFTKNALDNMIATGVVKPFILVAPTYYYNARKKLSDKEGFAREMVRDLIPAVEGTYHTYAETTDEAGLMASRDHRAVCGFSNGSGFTWFLLGRLLDYSRYFLPCSGAALSDAEYASVLQAFQDRPDDFFIYMSSGGKEDVAYAHSLGFVEKLLKDASHLHYGADMKADNFFFSLSENPHLDNCTRYYLYNAFTDGLFRMQAEE